MDIGQVYKCNICGNIVAVRHAGKGQLMCCGKPMELLVERTADEGYEKHVPVVNGDDEITVTVGNVPHPMMDKHYIEWIEVSDSDGLSQVKFLSPTDQPQARFKVSSRVARVRAYCNLHGLWKKETEER